jgi:hypothetical protein
MVADTGATDGPGRVRPFGIAQGRPLNRPRPLRVEAGEDGQPTAIYLSPRRAGVRPRRRYAVEAVLETWRIDDEWWRERPVSRVYYSLLLEDGQVVTVYWEEAKKLWARQRY